MIPVANPVFGAEEQRAVQRVLEDGTVADGPEVRAFESEFADYCEAEYGVAMANGTVALHAALVALDIGAGDTVVTTPFSFVASSNAIRLAGATPVFADIDPETFALDPEAAERAVRDVGADAILAVHLYGLPADLSALGDVADDAGIPLIEDAAQAHGAEFEGTRIGSFGDAAAFSFYPTKNMTTGEGGIVLTDRADVAERAASFANHGRADDTPYAHERVGSNYRMTSIGAAIGRVQLKHLPNWVDTRRSNARRLTDALAEVPDVEAPFEPSNRRHAYHQYTVKTDDRDRLQRHLEASGISSAVYYPTPIHKLQAYAEFDAHTPIAERISNQVLSLPVHPRLTEEELVAIEGAVKSLPVEQ